MSAFEPSPGVATPSRHAAISIAILAFSAFLIVTTEFLIVGLLPALSQDLGISISLAGQLVTLFAFTVMLAGPLLTAALAHLDRKRLFIGILLVFAAANALAAASGSFWVLAVARVIPALALPVFWGTASETAGHLAGRDRAGQAIAKVYLGISAAMLLGIPLGTVAATAVGWRGAFWILAALSLLMALAMWVWMPHVARTAKVDFMQQARIFKERFPGQCAAVGGGVHGHVHGLHLPGRPAAAGSGRGPGAYRLVADGLWRGRLAWQLDRRAGRGPLTAQGQRAVPGAVGHWHGGAGAAGPGAVLFCLALALWGIANTALYPVSQVRVMSSVTHAQALAGTTNVSAANAGIGLGAVLGGMTISHLGVGYVGYVAAGIALLALALVPVVGRLAPQPGAQARLP